MEKSKSSLLSSSMLCVRQMVLRVGFKFKLATARVRTPRPSRLLMALLVGSGVQGAFALPQGGQVAAGNVSIGTPANNALNITQTSAKGVINWQSFNVGSGEKVNFQQPGATSSTLNRVVGSDPSAIFGQINANGQVFLINNSGILFGPGAQVNAAGLVASSLQLTDGNYLDGKYVFDGSGGAVANQGVLKAGFVALAGAQVSNTGTIVANGGTAALAAGDRVTLNLIGNDLVSMSVDAPTAAALVHAGGVVQADGGKVLISAKAADALLGTVVNVDGIVQARSIGSRNGVITLDGGNSGVVAVSGKLDASGQGAGQTGGTVKVTGADVGLFGHASVDVSGNAGGGVVRIGGDWHGAGADGDANASQAYVGSHATIAANATGSGKGGDVVVWSDDHTQFFGKIDARGAGAGDGGSVETSGHSLNVDGNVDASSATGKGGTWLLDPIDVTIQSGASGTDITQSGSAFLSSFTKNTIRDTVLAQAVTSGTSISVETSSATGGSGDITVTGNVALSTAQLSGTQKATLSLDAIGNIVFTGGKISAPNGTRLTVNLNAGTNNSHGSPGTNTSSISMDAASSIDLGATGASKLTATAKGNIQLGGLTVGTGGVQITSNGGAVTQSSALTVNGTLTADTANGNVTLNTAGNHIGIYAGNAGTGTVSVHNASTLDLGGIHASSLNIDTSENNSDVAQASGDLTISGGVTINAGTGGVGAGSGASTIGHIGTTGNFTFLQASSLVLDNISATALLTSTGTAGSVTQSSGSTITAASTDLHAGTGGVTLVNGNTIGTYGAQTTGTASFTNNAGVNLGDVTAATLTVDTSAGNGNVGQAASTNLAVTNGLTITAGTGNITAGSTTSTIGHATTSGSATNLSAASLVLDNITATTFSGTSGATGSITQSTGDTIHATTSASLTGGSGGVALASITTPTLSVDTSAHNGNVTQVSGSALAVSGGATINAGTGDITAGGVTSTIGHIGTTGHVTNLSAATLVLDNVSATSLTTHTATAGSVTQTGGDTITATTTDLHAGTGGVTLINGNTIGTYSAATTGAASFTNNGGVNLGGVSATSLVVDTSGGNGNVTQAASTNLAIGGGLTITAGTGNVTAGSGTSTIGHVASSGQVTDLAATTLVLDNISATTLTTHTGVNGSVTQTGGDTITATTTDLHAGTGGVTLVNGNTIGTYGAATTGAASFTNNGGVNLGGVSATSLVVDTSGGNGNVTQAASTNLAIGGGLTITAGTGSVTAGSTNSTIGHVASSGGATALRASSLLLDNVAATSLTTATGTAGSVTQTGGDTITATSASFGAGSGGVTIANSGNSIGTWGANTTGSATFTSTGAIALDAVTANAATIHAGGAISQNSGTVAVNGATGLDAAGNAITLGATGNTFGGPVSVNHAGAVTITDTGPLTVHLANTASATLTSTGALAVDGATSGALSAGGNGVTLGSASTALNVGTTLGVQSGAGSITQGHSITVGGASTLAAGSNDIALGNPANTFGATVTATGHSVNIAATGALDANVTLTGGTGDLTLASTGALSGTSAVTTTGNISLTTGGALTTAGVLSGNDVSLTGTSVSIGTDIHAGNDLNLHATGGAIAQTAGTITAQGATSLTAAGAGNSITLNGAANSLVGAVTVSGSSVAVTDTSALAISGSATSDLAASGNGIAFGATTVGGALTANAGNGAISQSGVLAVTGTSSLNAGTGAITLANAGNTLTGAVSATGAAVTLTDAQALTAHLAATGAVVLTASTGAVNVDGNAGGGLAATGNGVAFGATTVGGNLSASGGAITQTGPVSVTGTSALNAGSHAVTLDNTGNDFVGAVTATGNNVSLSDANALTAHLTTTNATLVAGGAVIADGATTGAVNVTAASADIEQAGALTVHLNNVGNTVVKSNAALHVDGTSTGNVTAGGSTVTLGGSALSVGGNLAATSTAGDISQAGTLSVTGTSNLAATGGNVTLADTHNALGGAVTASGTNVTLVDASALTAHLAANGSATLTSASGLSVDGSANALNVTGTSIAFGAAGTTVNGALTTNGGGVSQAGTLAVTGLSTFNAGTGDIALATPGTNLQGAIKATGHAISLSDAHAIDADITATGDVALTSTGDVHAKGTFGGGLALSGAKVTLDQGTLATPLAIGGKLDVTSTGNTSLTYVTANGAQVTAGGTLLLNGTLKSTAGDVTLKASNGIQGVNKLGAIDAAAGAKLSLDTSGGGNIGKATAALGVLDPDAIIGLLNVSGQSGFTVKFGAGGSAWFRVASQAQTPLLHPTSTNSSQTFFCDLSTCVNILGQSTAIADSVIANILTSASQDAADAAFGTENLDFAIRKGYVTTIGRVPPGIDEIAGDLGATQCDSRVTSATAIAADKACSAGAKAGK